MVHDTFCAYSLGNLEKQIYLNEEIIHSLQIKFPKAVFCMKDFEEKKYLLVGHPLKNSDKIYEYVFSNERRYKPDMIFA